MLVCGECHKPHPAPACRLPRTLCVMKLANLPIKESAFKTTKDGKRIYFPSGVLGKGYIVESDEIYEKLLSHHKRWMYGALIIGILAISKSLVAIVLGLVTYITAHQFFTKKAIKGLEVSTERLTFSEVRENTKEYRKPSKFTLYFFIVLGMVLLVFGGLLLVSAPETFWFGFGFALPGTVLIYFSLRRLRCHT